MLSQRLGWLYWKDVQRQSPQFGFHQQYRLILFGYPSKITIFHILFITHFVCTYFIYFIYTYGIGAEKNSAFHFISFLPFWIMIYWRHAILTCKIYVVTWIIIHLRKDEQIRSSVFEILPPTGLFTTCMGVHTSL